MARTVKLGYRDREVKVDVDPRRLERYQVSLGEIIQAIIARNIRLSGGTFESYTSEHNILTLAQFSRPEEVGEMIVRSSFEGPLITVKDLAVIRTVQGVRRLVAEERVRRLAAEEGARSLAGSRPPGAEGGRQGGRPGGGSDQSTAQTGSTRRSCSSGFSVPSARRRPWTSFPSARPRSISPRTSPSTWKTACASS